MPRTETTLQIFVASPSDLQPERDLLEDVIAELNIAVGAQHSIKLALLRWETHSAPGFGADAQDVINQQLSEPYDIFVGMMWTRFGTPTSRAASGTQEEFERAYARFQQDPQSVDIMFYFKNAPVSPASLDPTQLGLVQDFKKRLQKLGGLYFDFTSSDDFRNNVRVHLARSIQKWSKRLAVPVDASLTTAPPVHTTAAPSRGTELATTMSEDLQEDEGLFDLLDRSDLASAQCTESLGKLTSAIADLAARFQERTDEVNTIQREGGTPDRATARRIVDRAASDLDSFVRRSNTELPLFSEALASMLDTIGKGALIVAESDNDATSQVQGALENLAGLKEAIETSRVQVVNFRTVTSRLPRTTSAFNKSRRNALLTLDRLLDEMRKGIEKSGELEQLLRSLIPPDDDSADDSLANGDDTAP